jgi:hypothetical protein
MSAKLDLYKQHAEEYRSPRQPILLDIAPAQYLAIDGRGAPGGEEFTERLSALYAAAFTIKMASKFGGQDYAVSKLEGLWWGPDAKVHLLDTPRHEWRWTLMIRTPDFIGAKELANAVEALLRKAKTAPLKEVKIEKLEEGRCVQMLHVGPYDAERQTIDQMLRHAAVHGLAPRGKHHEIYLSDPRRVAPERLRTILRQPLR